MLRKQAFAALRIAHALVAVVARAWITVFPGQVVVAAVGIWMKITTAHRGGGQGSGCILVITGFILFRVGLFTGR